MPAPRGYLYRTNPARLVPLDGGPELLVDGGVDVPVQRVQPSAATTGAKGTLANYQGDLTNIAAGSTISNLDVSGLATVNTANVTIRNCRFRGRPPDTVVRGVINGQSSGATNLLIEDVTIEPDVPHNQLTGIYAADFTARRCDISGTTDGLASYGRYTVEDVFVHDLAYMPAAYQDDGVTHNDGMQVFGGRGVLRGFYFDMRAHPTKSTAPLPGYGRAIGQAIALTPTASTITDLLIEEGWIDYGFRGIGGTGSAFPGGAILIRNTRFGPGIASFPSAGIGSARRPIIVDTTLNLTGLGTAVGPTVDTTNGNVNFDGTPISYWRKTP